MMSKGHVQPRHGFALPFVLAVLVVLGLGVSTVLYVLVAGVAEKKRAFGEMNAFYAVDSAVRISSAIAEAAALAAGTEHGEQITQSTMDTLCTQAGGCLGTRLDASVEKRPAGPATLPGYPYVAEYRASEPGEAVGPDGLVPADCDLEHFLLMIQPAQRVGLIESGPVAGLLGAQTNVLIQAQAVHRPTASVAHGRDKVSLSAISPFELMLFSTLPGTGWAPLRARAPEDNGLPLTRNGPSVLVDGPVRLGGTNTLSLTRVVSTGPAAGVAFVSSSRAWNGDATSPAYNVTTANNTTVSTSTNTVRLKAQPGAKQAQPNAELAQSARWLLDPVITAGQPDPEAAAKTKLAGQADIRIIDGLWYVRPRFDDTTTPSWPGILVWSDHAGSNVTAPSSETRALIGSGAGDAATSLIGQDDIVTARGLAQKPQRYSYYEATPGSAVVLATHRDGSVNSGIISYGLTRWSTAASRVVPAGPTGLSLPCANATPTDDHGEGHLELWSALYGDTRLCDAGRQTAVLMDGTRYGFIDQNAPAATEAILPMNFDVGAFLDAMADGTPGELGSYFCGASSTAALATSSDVPTRGCRKFNGIVYITNTWSGSLNGLTTTGTPTPPPEQGDGENPSAIGGAFTAMPNAHGGDARGDSGGEMRTWPPHQLCSAAALEAATITDAGTQGMRAVGCGTEAYNALHAATKPRPTANAVRIINGRDLSRIIGAELPARYGNGVGLTIASNLPVYVNGDFNVVAAAPASAALVCTGASPPEGCAFPQALVAGDRVTFLSNPTAVDKGVTPRAGWQDNFFFWHSDVAAQSATPTTFVTHVMTTVSPGTMENAEAAFRVIEDWRSNAINVRGSLFLTGRAVYRTDPQSYATDAVPGAPLLNWTFNPDSADVAQPPGAPRFVVGVSGRWRDLRESD